MELSARDGSGVVTVAQAWEVPTGDRSMMAVPAPPMPRTTTSVRRMEEALPFRQTPISAPLPGSPRAVICKRRRSSGGRQHSVKPTHLSAYRFVVGDWMSDAQYNGELTVKLYHSRAQIVFERLDQGVKRKLQFAFETIHEMYSTDVNVRVTQLIFVLNAPPHAHDESNPTPRTNTMWHPAAVDFCNQQSTVCNTMIAYVKRSTATKHIEKLRSMSPVIGAVFRSGPPLFQSRKYNDETLLNHRAVAGASGPHADPSLLLEHHRSRLMECDWDDASSSAASSYGSYASDHDVGDPQYSNDGNGNHTRAGLEIFPMVSPIFPGDAGAPSSRGQS
ncbi:Uncharacterized protein PBTT_03655 [Plasmodiophora brassicae]|uniref:TRF2/HOY1 PH-like domain-containing protein n=1 Tax=Plasmodiophora brassicae TaxID=37360 RepID=A0A3P3Y7J6_PLABS|nr:unnamed protein product [Plasmodiophora brassicae]